MVTQSIVVVRFRVGAIEGGYAYSLTFSLLRRRRRWGRRRRRGLGALRGLGRDDLPSIRGGTRLDHEMLGVAETHVLILGGRLAHGIEGIRAWRTCHVRPGWAYRLRLVP